MLLDLSDFVAPCLTIMDAVIGMEGEGPNNGVPRPIGLILASTSPLALDVIAGDIIDSIYESRRTRIKTAEWWSVNGRAESGYPERIHQ